MPEETQEFIHNGRKIVISQPGAALAPSAAAERAIAPVAEGASAPVAEVSIDGESIPVEFDPGTQQYQEAAKVASRFCAW